MFRRAKSEKVRLVLGKRRTENPGLKSDSGRFVKDESIPLIPPVRSYLKGPGKHAPTLKELSESSEACIQLNRSPCEGS